VSELLNHQSSSSSNSVYQYIFFLSIYRRILFRKTQEDTFQEHPGGYCSGDPGGYCPGNPGGYCSNTYQILD